MVGTRVDIGKRFMGVILAEIRCIKAVAQQGKKKSDRLYR